MDNKKGQVAILIIIGIAFVVILFILFFLFSGRDKIDINKSNPNQYLQSCIEEIIERGLEKVQTNAGHLEPKKTIYYGERNVTYFCYTSDYMKSCSPLLPAPFEDVEKNLLEFSEDKIEGCFNSLKQDLELEGYEVTLTNTKNFEISLIPNEIIARIEKPIRIRKGDSDNTFNNFEIKVNSPIWHFLYFAQKIMINYQREGISKHMLLLGIYHNRIDIIQNYLTGSGTYIYTLKRQGEEFKFAIRNQVVPPYYNEE